MAKRTCERCGKVFNDADSRAAYEEHYNGEGDYDWDFGESCLCPDCVLEDCEEMDSNALSPSDAADIWYSSGQDEDYMFNYSADELDDAHNS